jgi:CRISPR-associated exonuclease Cas4
VRGLKLRSLELGLSGVADVVEFHRVGADGVALPGKKGLWKPFPVEYKRGKPKSDRCDEVQICGQAICLEEMLGCSIETGALYYGSQHKRHEVVFDQPLRAETIETCRRLHELVGKRATPPAKYEKKCEKCSMIDICVPKMQSRDVEKYLESIVQS